MQDTSQVLHAARMLRLAERPLPQLTPVPFAVLAAELALVLHQEGLQCDALEWALGSGQLNLAKRPEEDNEQLERLARTRLIEERRHIAILGQAAALLAALRPHEAQIRAMIGQGTA